jgi:hypothetical protein
LGTAGTAQYHARVAITPRNFIQVRKNNEGGVFLLKIFPIAPFSFLMHWLVLVAMSLAAMKKESFFIWHSAQVG